MRGGERLTPQERKIKARNIREGPTKLILIRAKRGDLYKIQNDLQVLKRSQVQIYQNHYNNEILNVYSKKQALCDLKTEKLLRKIIGIATTIMFMITFILFINIKVLLDIDYMSARARLYNCKTINILERQAAFFMLLCIIFELIYGKLFRMFVIKKAEGFYE